MGSISKHFGQLLIKKLSPTTARTVPVGLTTISNNKRGYLTISLDSGNFSYHGSLTTKDFGRRMIYLDGQVDDSMAELIISQLRYLSKFGSAEPITMLINSSSGAPSAGLAIFDMIQSIRPPVTTHVVGRSCTASTIALLGGQMRKATPNSSIRVNEGILYPWGQPTFLPEMEYRLEVMEFWRNRLVDVLMQQTNHSRVFIERIITEPKILSTIEAKNLGILNDTQATHM
ncbi:ATP-dependent Clp protease proteolytic subunit-like [Watersipora subatra]|uniref:ATP-dependent Clp protease proteolytic subunit-like n=1 Tax=Watersipora subatra TaxID=2589382 RepID=UPI00355C6706